MTFWEFSKRSGSSAFLESKAVKTFRHESQGVDMVAHDRLRDDFMAENESREDSSHEEK